MYLIEEIWTDRSENSYDKAVGYNAIGYVETLEEAEQIISNGRFYTKSDCWAIFNNMPQYRFKELLKIEINQAVEL